MELTDSHKSSAAMGDFLKFKEQFRGISRTQPLVGFSMLSELGKPLDQASDACLYLDTLSLKFKVSGRLIGLHSVASKQCLPQ